MPRGLLAASVALLGSAVLAACEMAAPALTLAVSTEEPAPSIGEAIVPLLDARQLTVRLRSMSDPQAILDGVSQGTIDLAVLEEPRGAVPGVVSLLPLYPSILHVLHRDTRSPASIGDLLRGQSIYAGPLGGAAYRVLIQLAADFRVAADEFRILDNPWAVDPDVYFIFGGLLSDDSRRQLDGFRLYSFADAGELGRGSIADGIVLRYPNLRTFVLPAGLYYAMNEAPVVTLAIRSLLVAREGLDVELAYRIAAGVFEHAQDIAFIYPLVTKELDAGFEPGSLTLALHPGARRYLERDKPGFLERYAELVALAVTIVLTLVSAAAAVYRWRKQQRKDRVDVYYDKILALRGRITTDLPLDSLRAIRREAIELQHEVFGLVVDERIAADESLTVFLHLSNQVLRELDRIDR